MNDNNLRGVIEAALRVGKERNALLAKMKVSTLLNRPDEVIRHARELFGIRAEGASGSAISNEIFATVSHVIRDENEDIFQKGVDARLAGRNDEALRLFDELLSLRWTPSLHSLSGKAERQLAQTLSQAGRGKSRRLSNQE